MAEQAFVSRGTLYKVERGDPSASIRIYATVLSILGLAEGLGAVADRRKDLLGLDIDEDRLPQKVQSRGRSAVFEYTDTWLDHDDAFVLDPRICHAFDYTQSTDHPANAHDFSRPRIALSIFSTAQLQRLFRHRRGISRSVPAIPLANGELRLSSGIRFPVRAYVRRSYRAARCAFVANGRYT